MAGQCPAEVLQRVTAVGSPDPEAMRGIAAECVKLVGEQFGRRLDWSMASLGELDDVCEALLADRPLAGQRPELWWNLVGAYTGEVAIPRVRLWVAGNLSAVPGRNPNLSVACIPASGVLCAHVSAGTLA